MTYSFVNSTYLFKTLDGYKREGESVSRVYALVDDPHNHRSRPRTNPRFRSFASPRRTFSLFLSCCGVRLCPLPCLFPVGREKSLAEEGEEVTAIARGTGTGTGLENERDRGRGGDQGTVHGTVLAIAPATGAGTGQGIEAGRGTVPETVGGTEGGTAGTGAGHLTATGAAAAIAIAIAIATVGARDRATGRATATTAGDGGRMGIAPRMMGKEDCDGRDGGMAVCSPSRFREGEVASAGCRFPPVVAMLDDDDDGDGVASG